MRLSSNCQTATRGSVDCEIKYEKTQAQYSLYQECVFLCLISGCTTYRPTICQLSTANQYHHTLAEYCTMQTIIH
eukprot:1256185-Rhodomonas_salina.2